MRRIPSIANSGIIVFPCHDVHSKDSTTPADTYSNVVEMKGKVENYDRAKAGDPILYTILYTMLYLIYPSAQAQREHILKVGV